MTDEQIKQNAEKCADGFIADAIFKRYLRDTYIAGAHSRDEEIEELKEEIESLQKQYNTCFDGFTKRGTKLGELMKENVKLRNPWISVEDRLPEIGQKVITITNKGKLLLVARTTQPPHKEEGGWRWEHYVGKVTHWMPIPELKKGE